MDYTPFALSSTPPIPSSNSSSSSSSAAAAASLSASSSSSAVERGGRKGSRKERRSSISRSLSATRGNNPPVPGPVPTVTGGSPSNYLLPLIAPAPNGSGGGGGGASLQQEINVQFEGQQGSMPPPGSYGSLASMMVACPSYLGGSMQGGGTTTTTTPTLERPGGENVPHSQLPNQPLRSYASMPSLPSSSSPFGYPHHLTPSASQSPNLTQPMPNSAIFQHQGYATTQDGNYTLTFHGPGMTKPRRKTSMSQFRRLEETFHQCPKPDGTTRRDLAIELGMPVRAVQVWFQNRRAKAKIQDLRSRAASVDEGGGMERGKSMEASSSSSSSSSSSHGGTQVPMGLGVSEEGGRSKDPMVSEAITTSSPMAPLLTKERGGEGGKEGKEEGMENGWLDDLMKSLEDPKLMELIQSNVTSSNQTMDPSSSSSSPSSSLTAATASQNTFMSPAAAPGMGGGINPTPPPPAPPSSSLPYQSDLFPMEGGGGGGGGGLGGDGMDFSQFLTKDTTAHPSTSLAPTTSKVSQDDSSLQGTLRKMMSTPIFPSPSPTPPFTQRGDGGEKGAVMVTQTQGKDQGRQIRRMQTTTNLREGSTFDMGEQLVDWGGSMHPNTPTGNVIESSG